MELPETLERLMSTRPGFDRTIEPADHTPGLTPAERREALTNLAATRSRARLRGDFHLVAICDEQARRIATPPKPWQT